jgi:C4-dicarboxylate transporter, DctM subunit
MQLSPLQLISVVILFYLVLGALMDEMAMMIATVPFVAPVVFAAGFDPVWFGILLVVLMEAGMILPPVGINLFVVQGLRGGGSINDIILGMLPFLGAMLFLAVLLIAFPQIALWLPAAVQ